MKIDNERPYHSNSFHELLSSGGPKVDGESETETKNNLVEDKMVEQTNPSEHSFVKAEHEKGGKTRQVRIEDVSYDKDVIEINLPDAVVYSDYGGHFVKDVCIDDGVLADQKASAEKVVIEKVYPIFDSSMADPNGDMKEDMRVDPVKTAHKSRIVPLYVAFANDDNTMEEIRADPLKSAHELESQIVTLDVACATDGNNMEQYSSGEARALEGNKSTNDFTSVNNMKSSPRQLSSHEATKQRQQVGTVISESCDGESIDEVASNDCHKTGSSIAPESSYLSGLPVESTSDGLSAAIPGEDVGAELDNRGLNPYDHYNPFIAYGSLGNTWESKYALPTSADDVSVVPICPVGKTDSFSDLVNGGKLGGFNDVETAESRIGDSSRLDSAGARSSRLGLQASEESHDQRESLVERTDSFSDIVKGTPGGFDSIKANETRIKHSTLDSIEESSGRLDVQASEESSDQIRIDGAHGTGTVGAEPSDIKSENHPKCETGAVQDEHEFNPRDMEDGTKTRGENSGGDQSSTVAQTESAVQQNGPDTAKLTTRGGIRNPFELSFSGANITLDSLTPSSQIGNISLRSDSSTTSTRSFAFPVLQEEWNSSPVRMAKADRRRFRRDRSWGYRVLCCKF